MVGGSGGTPVDRGLLAAVHRTVRSGPRAGTLSVPFGGRRWSRAGTGPHSGQLRPEMVSRTLVMISAGIGA